MHGGLFLTQRGRRVFFNTEETEGNTEVHRGFFNTEGSRPPDLQFETGEGQDNGITQGKQLFMWFFLTQRKQRATRRCTEGFFTTEGTEEKHGGARRVLDE